MYSSAGRIVSGSASPGKSTLPAIPLKTAPMSKTRMHPTAIFPPCRMSRWLRAAMKRVRSWGAPRKANPIAMKPATLMIPARLKPLAPMSTRRFGSSARIPSMSAEPATDTGHPHDR